jgi:protein involved in polysaccharide export with SLBB domain
MVVNIAKDEDGMPKDNPPLKEDDYLLVKTVPAWQLYRHAVIRGEVLFPGTYVIEKGERLADLVIRAGGFTEDAYLKGVVFTRKSVQETQQKMLEKATDRLEQEVLSAGATKTATALTEGESKILEAQTRQYQQLIEKLRQVEAIGRLVISVAPLRVLRDTPANVQLEDGDEIFVPSKMATINVMGSVYNPSTYLYDPKTKIGPYIAMAGGPTDNADPGNTYVIKVDGSAFSPKKIRGGLFEWNTEAHRWEVGTSPRAKLHPGDTIIVPQKFDRLAIMRNIKDISQIIFQMAVTAGVVVALF